ncbi:ester cyclase [Shimia abyssi]|uniref:Steroid delta-isomerase-like uncharacterized protein n=1 Tax=Shimia abyssi TaxID=1662395 RepID=A0A2P8FE57_9RHOB|nr:ester cyclase [Shimia abyssi]PSL20005.1 steroid delta-isomerase-like uncharacterized protein [Shimia abyssi]
MHDETLSANKAVVQRYIDEIQNGHAIETIDDIFAVDFMDHTASGGGAFVGGLDGLKAGYTLFLKAFPDLQATVEAIIAEGDRVVAYKTLTGTHSDTWLDIPATGAQVAFRIVSIYRVRNGKIQEFWGLQDETALRQQLNDARTG